MLDICSSTSMCYKLINCGYIYAFNNLCANCHGLTNSICINDLLLATIVHLNIILRFLYFKCTMKVFSFLVFSFRTRQLISLQRRKATIFLFLGLRISWQQKQVGRSEKIKKIQKALLCQVVEKSYQYMEIVIKSDLLRNY